MKTGLGPVASKLVGVDGLNPFVFLGFMSSTVILHIKTILSVFYNPDNLSSINSLLTKFKNPHLYSTSVDHLFQLLQNIFLHCGELEELTYHVSKVPSAPQKPINTDFYSELKNTQPRLMQLTKSFMHPSLEYKALPAVERTPAVAAPSSAVASAISFSHRHHDFALSY